MAPCAASAQLPGLVTASADAASDEARNLRLSMEALPREPNWHELTLWPVSSHNLNRVSIAAAALGGPDSDKRTSRGLAFNTILCQPTKLTKILLLFATQVLLPKHEYRSVRVKHENLFVFAFKSHTRPSDAPTTRVSCYLEAIFAHVGLESFTGHFASGIRTEEICRRKES